jgi:lysozyme
MNLVTRRAALRRAAKLISEFEGGRSPDGEYRAYRDPVGVWTIGHGETQGVRPGMVWSKRKADRMLRRRLKRDVLPALERAIPPGTRLTANQAAATLSFCWNLGVGMLEASHMFGRHLRAGHKRQAWDSMLMYDKAGGRTLPGLTRRRQAERALALKR